MKQVKKGFIAFLFLSITILSGVKAQSANTSHEVLKGETLYGISRKYNVSVEELKTINNLETNALSVGQQLKIPVEKPPVSVVAKAVVHQVQKGETLYAIAQKYKVSVAILKAENKLESNALRVGQILQIPETASSPETGQSARLASEDKLNGIHIVQQGETLYAIAKQYQMTIEELKKTNNLSDNNLSPGLQLKVIVIDEAYPGNPQISHPIEQKGANPAAEEVIAAVESTSEQKNSYMELELLASEGEVVVPANAKISYVTDPQSGERYKRIEEKGKAISLTDTEIDQAKFYALHASLPEGSYIRVDYPAKRQSILVEVAGRLKQQGAVIALTAKSRKYLLLPEDGGEVILRYTTLEK